MIDERDIRIDTFSNMVGAQVKITHLPTGKNAQSGFHKSHLKARQEAMERLYRTLGLEPTRQSSRSES